MVHPVDLEQGRYELRDDPVDDLPMGVHQFVDVHLEAVGPDQLEPGAGVQMEELHRQREPVPRARHTRLHDVAHPELLPRPLGGLARAEGQARVGVDDGEPARRAEPPAEVDRQALGEPALPHPRRGPFEGQHGDRRSGSEAGNLPLGGVAPPQAERS